MIIITIIKVYYRRIGIRIPVQIKMDGIFMYIKIILYRSCIFHFGRNHRYSSSKGIIRRSRTTQTTR